MRILALDPATRCGWAFVDTRVGVRTYGTWDLGVSGSEHAGKRLVRLRARLEFVVDRPGIDKIAFEDASFGSINPQTAAFHNMLRGVILMVAATHDIPFVLYKPATIKKFATGYGNAKKDQMRRACKNILGVDVGDDDNQADALFILELAKQENAVLREAAAKKKPNSRRTSPQGKLW